MVSYWSVVFFFFKQKTAYEMRISDWSSDVCSSDLARERIEAMLERDYQMQKTGNCDYTLTVAYDQGADGVSLDDEIASLQTEMFNIAESYRCSIETDVYEIGGQERAW